MTTPSAAPRISALADADLLSVIKLLETVASRESLASSKFVRQVLLDANFRREGAIVARNGDRVVGFMLALARQVPLENAPSDAERGYITLFGVLPEFQRQGVASRMLERAEAYLKSQNRRLVMISSYAPGYFIPGVDVNAYPAALSFLKKHGYAEVYRPLAMETSLWSLAVPDFVCEKRRALERDGVTIEPYRFELTLPLLEFTAKEFPGDWVRVVREAMSRITLGESPSRVIVAHRNGEVVGFSHHDAERFGPIGVAASQRGKGLGHVLMFETLEAQKRAGFRAAWFLWSDDKTAQRIYNVAGFKEVRRFALMRKELA
jgi:GNAT superfamily N-acetyltransferase